jgi:hypothetical protein
MLVRTNPGTLSEFLLRVFPVRDHRRLDPGCDLHARNVGLLRGEGSVR